MSSSLILVMGRIAGVTAAETRERLLLAAADVFARRGYDGTRVADIAVAADVSSGALYAHFGSKAELLVAALRTHGRRLFAEVLAADPGRPVTDLLLLIGRRLPRRRDARGYLIVEALVAARRDEDVARPMRDYVGERGDWLAELVRVARPAGNSTRRCRPARWPTSASFSQWAVRSSRRTSMGSLRRSGPRCSPGWSPASPRPPLPHRQEQRDESADQSRAVPGARPLL